MEINFGTVNIFELGQLISKKLKDDGITTPSELFVYVTNKEFQKIDEDLFYRNKKDESEIFVPSENEINILFDLVKIIIKVKN